MLLSYVISLPLNQPINTRGAYIKFVLIHLERHYRITEGFPGKRRLLTLLEQYHRWIHVDQLRG